MSKFLTIILLVLFISSCEKVVDLPLNDADKRIVFEAMLNDRVNESYILISKTAGVYDNSGYEKISGATIKVTDANGLDYFFTEDVSEIGRYISPGFIVEENQTYTLDALVEGSSITAIGTSRSTPKMDSIGYFEFISPFHPDSIEYVAEYYSTDNVNEKNNYRMKIWENQKEIGFYFIGDDLLINGQTYDAQFFGTTHALGDTVFIEMIEMDDDMYAYVVGLANEADNSSFSASPANPVTNLQGDGDLLGYFGVFMTDTLSMIIE